MENLMACQREKWKASAMVTSKDLKSGEWTAARMVNLLVLLIGKIRVARKELEKEE